MTGRLRSPVLAAAMLACLVAVTAAPGCKRGSKSPAGFTISRETTFLLGPINPDGTVNYVEALDALVSEGVTPENNAAVPLLKALGPRAIPEQAREETLRRLGVGPLPENGEYFVGIGEFAEARVPAPPPPPPVPSSLPRPPLPPGPFPPPARQDPAREKAASEAAEMRGLATTRPWTAREFPLVEEWLKANDRPLALVVEATRRPRCYVPLVSTSDPPLMMHVLLPALGLYREVARALAARAMLRFSSGDFQGAREDLLAVHRLARAVSQGPFLIERLVAIFIESLATSAETALATGAYLSAEQAKALLADLEALPSLPNVTDPIAVGERLSILDLVMVIYRQGWPENLEEVGGQLRSDPARGAGREGLNWDRLLLAVNAWFDRHLQAASRPTAAERAAAFADLAADSRKSADEVQKQGGRRRVTDFLGRKVPIWREVTRAARARYLEDCFLTAFLPYLGRVSEIREEGIMRLHLARIALALAACKAEKGAYPEKLTDLCPGYLNAVPQDLFTEGPLRYERTQRGYLLYSVGANLTDDGGRDKQQGADDLVIRAE